MGLSSPFSQQFWYDKSPYAELPGQGHAVQKSRGLCQVGHATVDLGAPPAVIVGSLDHPKSGDKNQPVLRSFEHALRFFPS